MLHLPHGIQAYDYDCGAKALQIVMAYYGIEIAENDLIKELGTDHNGTAVDKMVAVARKYGFDVVAKCGLTPSNIKEFIEKEIPVIVLLQAWANRYMTLDDWRNDYRDGHYAIVVGYTDHIIVFQDPSSFRKVWLKEREFLARWHDMDPRTGNKLEHFGMVLLGRQPVSKAMKHMD